MAKAGERLMVGRPPIPTHLKIIRGNPGKRKLNPREPKPAGDLKEAPAHFDDETRAVWNYAIENAPAGLLKRLDSGVLEIWCAAYVLHRQAIEQVRKLGVLVKAPKSDLMIQSPYLPVVNKQALIMMRAIDRLGFSPASRTRVSIDAPNPAQGDWEGVG